ncbi:MAG: DnaD domain protein [Thermacetogeniaceae bacterium]
MPNLILKYSSRLNLSSNDILVLLACFYFQQQGKNELKNKDFTRLLNMPEKGVKTSIESMTARGLMSENGYDLCGLFEKISDIWAVDNIMQEAHQEVATSGEQISDGETQSQHFHALLQAFEREFGRALSQIECATIFSWHKDKGYSELIILEALKRAVLRGILNLTYIDRILGQWSKKNLRTTQEVDKHEEQYLSSRLLNKEKGQSDREARIKDKEDKYKDIYIS